MESFGSEQVYLMQKSPLEVGSYLSIFPNKEFPKIFDTIICVLESKRQLCDLSK